MNPILRLAVIAAVSALSVGQTADAAIVVGLVLDPATTAGSSPDVNSIYSGLGTWHMFAVDDNDDDFGISSYNINLTGASEIRHTSPSASAIADANGDFHEAGFNLLRSASGTTASSSIHASQPLPDQSPFLITGLGQQAGSFAAATGGATSPSWGAYDTISPLNGKNWLFLAEGKYEPGVLPSIAQASFTVYNNQATFGSKLSYAAIVPEPITPALLTPEYVAQISTPPPPPPPLPKPVVTVPNNPPTVIPPVVAQPIVPPPVVTPPPVVAPKLPAQPITAHPANEAVVVGMVVQPGSESGSSPGTWQLFAVDNNIGDFGISSYNVNISGAATVRHMSPTTRAIQDSDGNPIDGGFSLLRGVSGADGSHSIHAAQGLPGQSPLLITGFGKETGSFAAEAATRLGSTSLPAGASPDWGDYSTISPLNGNSWLLLAEGTYDTAPPIITQANFTVYNDPTTFASSLSPVTVIPEPITPTLLTAEYFERLTPPPAPLPIESPVPIEVPPITQPESKPIVPTQPIDDLPIQLIDELPTSVIVIGDPQGTVFPVRLPEPTIGDGQWIVIGDPFIRDRYVGVPIIDEFS